MFDGNRTTTFQNVAETNEVSIDIRFRMFYGIPHPCLCSKMHHAFEVVPDEQISHVGPV